MFKRSSKNSDRHDRSQNQSKNSRVGTIIKRTLLIALVAVALVVGTAFFLARSEPAHWKEHQQFLAETSPQQIEALAMQVQEKLKELANFGLEDTSGNKTSVTNWVQSLTQSQETMTEDGTQSETEQPKVKPEDVRINIEKTLTLNNEQLAAVVQTRMDDWMQQRGYVRPKEIKDPMIAVRGGQLVMAFRMQSGLFTAVISGKFNLNILDNGMAELTLNQFLVGKLPVPANALGEHLRKQAGGDSRAAEAGEWLGKLQYLQIKPVLELEHRRRARVMDYKLHNDGLDLQVRIQDHVTYRSMNNALAGVPVN